MVAPPGTSGGGGKRTTAPPVYEPELLKIFKIKIKNQKISKNKTTDFGSLSLSVHPEISRLH